MLGRNHSQVQIHVLDHENFLSLVIGSLKCNERKKLPQLSLEKSEN